MNQAATQESGCSLRSYVLTRTCIVHPIGVAARYSRVLHPREVRPV
jgi:hypothetical protein